METSTPKTGLHPLLTAAAISVTVFSAVGVGAMTGLLPHSFATSKPAAETALQTPGIPEQPIARSAPAAAEAANMPPASAASTPASPPVHKPAKKHVVAHASVPPAPAP